MGTNGSGWRLSRFAHTVSVRDGFVALFNSLSLHVVVVPTATAIRLKEPTEVERFRLSHPELGVELEKQRLLVPNEDSDTEALRVVREHLDHSPIGILYLLLTDRCNIACRYCYFEGAIPTSYRFSKMSAKTARDGINLFTRLLPSSLAHGLHEPQIILYGGEPFLNRPVLEAALEHIKKLWDDGTLPENTSVTINTNGTLLTRAIVQRLTEFPFVTLAISVDGPKEIHDSERVDRAGKPTFDRVRRGIDLVRAAGLKLGLCCTLAGHNLDHADEILVWLKNAYGISSLGFNILLETPKFGLADRLEYANRVAEKLIDCFLIAREEGIYEDRVMRKVKSFVNGQIYFYDCGGCGQQIVVSPDGHVGVCQAYCGTRKYFTPLIDDFDPDRHEYWREWRHRSPINMPECVDCIALGNCGGGCPYSADSRFGSIWRLDDSFCAFSKRMIQFLVKDLGEQLVDRLAVQLTHRSIAAS